MKVVVFYIHHTKRKDNMVPIENYNMEDLEAMKWLGKIYYKIYNHQDIPIGYTITLNEADMICKRNPTYQWDKTKQTGSLPLMTISDIN
jgi:hypothetical protein